MEVRPIGKAGHTSFIAVFFFIVLPIIFSANVNNKQQTQNKLLIEKFKAGLRVFVTGRNEC